MTTGIGIDKASELAPKDFDRLLLRTLTAVNAPPLLSASVPPLTEMLPVKVLLAVSASLPDPAR